MSDVAIVGGGIAGLAAAWELQQRGVAATVFEQSSRAGGVILTEQAGGFVIDAGPDALLIQKPAAIALCRELGLGDRLFPTLTPRTAFVKRGQRLLPLPDASFLGLPTRVAPFVRSSLFSWSGKLRMGAELIIPARRQAPDESIGSFIGRRFGREAVDYLAEPLLAGIHAGDVDRLSIMSSFPRLRDAERTRGSVLRGLVSMPTVASTQGAFMSLPGGVGEMTSVLIDRLRPDTIRYDAGVARIEGIGPYIVTLGSGERINARVVIVAAPAWAAAAMLAGVDRELADLYGGVRYASSAIAAFGFRREQVRHPLEGSGFVVPRVERQRITAATWVSSKWPHRAPRDHVLLRAFLGGALDPAIVEESDDAIGSAALRELSEILRIQGEPVLRRVYRWRRASAQHEVGHLDRIAAIEARLQRQPGLYVTGSGFRGTGIPDCIADARATATRAAALLQ